MQFNDLGIFADIR